MSTPPAEGHQRVILLLEYDGTRFSGLQRQEANPQTIQEQVEIACRQLGSLDVRFSAAGRTDAGVHATGQVVSVDVPLRLELRRAALAINSLLPRDIRVRRAVACPEGFSPRFDAIWRSYVYRLAVKTEVPPLFRHCVAFLPVSLDEAATIAATQCFAGKWEFREWRSRHCQGKRTLLTMMRAESSPPRRDESDPFHPARCWWEFHFQARSFLHHQVRMLVGGIVAVGSGRITVEALRTALAEGRRPPEAIVAPACGLEFRAVGYPEEVSPFRSTVDGAMLHHRTEEAPPA